MTFEEIEDEAEKLTAKLNQFIIENTVRDLDGLVILLRALSMTVDDVTYTYSNIFRKER